MQLRGTHFRGTLSRQTGKLGGFGGKSGGKCRQHILKELNDEQLLESMPQSKGRAQKRDPLDRADNAHGWGVRSQLFYKSLDNFH